MTWSIRPPTLRDVPAILNLVSAPAGEPDWSIEEVVATLTAPDIDSWLAVAPDGTVVAWAYLHDDRVEVYGDARRPLLEPAIARAIERARAAGLTEVTLTAVASEPAQVEVLESLDFAFVRRHARMRRALDGAEPPAASVATIRPLRPDADLPAFHFVLAEALPEHVPPDFEAWRDGIPDGIAASWDEWFVAELDGAIVGVLQSSDQGIADDEGWVRNLAVLTPYRRKGIGRALLATAFAAYLAKGRRWVGLGVDLSNPTGAHRLYASMGLVATFEAGVYARRISLGAARAPHP